MKYLVWGFALCLIVVSSLVAQELKVEGAVMDQQGEALPGVNIVIQGTSTGTVTDANGKYALTIPSGEINLVFTFVGMETVTEAVRGRTIIDVVMMDNQKQLDEVMVVAYGTTHGL